MKQLLIFCLVIVWATAGCKKNNDNNPPPPPPPGSDSINIYFTTLGDEGSGGSPGFWKNGVKTNLTSGTYGGDAKTIASGSTVYTGGSIYQSPGWVRYSPCYWQNSTRTDLPLLDPRGDGWVASLNVSGDKVFAVGTATDSLEFFANNGWRYLPCYWEGGEIHQLELINGFGPGFAISIDVTTEGLYVVGDSYADNGYQEPCIWSVANVGPNAGDLNVHQLSSYGYGGRANDVFAEQNRQYMAGFINTADGVNTPCYWSAGERTVLSKPDPNGDGYAKAICLRGLVVCVAGNYVDWSGDEPGGYAPCMWINGVRTDLPHLGLGGQTLSIHTNLNGDVYVGGYVNAANGFGYHPCYWKNGELFYNSTMSLANPPTDIVISE